MMDGLEERIRQIAAYSKTVEEAEKKLKKLHLGKGAFLVTEHNNKICISAKIDDGVQIAV